MRPIYSGRNVTVRRSATPKIKRRLVLAALGITGLTVAGLFTWQLYSRSSSTSSGQARRSSVAENTQAASTSAGLETEATKASTVTSAGLQQVIDDWIASHGTGYRIVARSLGSDTIVGSYKQDVATIPASTYKLFVVYAIYHLVEQGQFSLSAKLDSGVTLEHCIEKAIVNSDNTCAEALGSYIGWETVNKLVNAAGFSDTDINNYNSDGSYNGDKQSTATDLASYLTELHSGTLLNTAHTNSLLGYMKRQVYRSGIPAGSSSAVVADKVGFLDGITNDAAIVYGPSSTYVAVIMSTTGSNWANISDLASKIYDYLQ